MNCAGWRRKEGRRRKEWEVVSVLFVRRWRQQWGGKWRRRPWPSSEANKELSAAASSFLSSSPLSHHRVPTPCHAIPCHCRATHCLLLCRLLPCRPFIMFPPLAVVIPPVAVPFVAVPPCIEVILLLVLPAVRTWYGE